MCGRYCLESTADGLARHLQPWLKPDDAPWLKHYAPRALIRPGEPVLALRREHGESKAAHMLWGLLPGWVKDPLASHRPINARAESVAEKASFRGPWRHHRCLLPSTSFLEKGYQIGRNDQAIFWLAGLWDRWVGPDGSEVETCCVITTQANALIKPLHNRMPVIIPNGLEEIWLEPGDQHHRHALEPILSPAAEEGWYCRAPSSSNARETSLIQAEQLNLL